MLGLLVQAGYGVDSNEELADYVIVNTALSRRHGRIRRTLVELAEADKKIVITGCMVLPERLLEELPERRWLWLVPATITKL